MDLPNWYEASSCSDISSQFSTQFIFGHPSSKQLGLLQSPDRYEQVFALFFAELASYCNISQVVYERRWGSLANVKLEFR